MEMLLKITHILFAVISTWRIAELVTLDRISAPIRKNWPLYIWSCPRCVSVWAGIAATLLYVYLPWGNWPFALAWLYLWHTDSVVQKRLAEKGREVTIGIDQRGNLSVKRSDLNQQEIVKVAQAIVEQNKPKGT